MKIAIDFRLRDDDNFLIYKREMYNLFINNETNFTQLYLPQRFSHQVQLIPGAKECLSEMEFLIGIGTEYHDYRDIDESQSGSSRQQSIVPSTAHNTTEGDEEKEEQLVQQITIDTILIDATKNLKAVYFEYDNINESFCKRLENSLIKHGMWSSSSSLYRFKFYIPVALNSESLRLYFDNWKDRHPMRSRDNI
ncbi:hypothetical protein GLOIN_2v1780770 [Rhizophagus clarus]|uniref:Uncharacterized protein n=1 Tax=Rhizophagus clarus TaxID=94130 RepID=A0A8H3QDA2_9GLOM|nr:hypothetical protein GLOIN_2v1780770 [Rhizophagus clarus]